VVKVTCATAALTGFWRSFPYLPFPSLGQRLTAGQRGWHTGGRVVRAVRGTDDQCQRPRVRGGRAGHRGHGPGQGVGEDYSAGGQTVPELLNWFGADGWELAGLQDYRDGGDGTSY